MGRTIDEVLASLTHDERVQVATRSEALREQAEALRCLHAMAEAASSETLGSDRRPEVDSLTRQSASFLRALRRQLEADGGRLDFVVQIPGRASMTLDDLDDAVSWGEAVDHTASDASFHRAS